MVGFATNPKEAHRGVHVHVALAVLVNAKPVAPVVAEKSLCAVCVESLTAACVGEAANPAVGCTAVHVYLPLPVVVSIGFSILLHRDPLCWAPTV